MQKRVIVVIPVYKEELSELEKISLQQVYRILGKYPICFVAPEHMRNFLTEKNVLAEYFHNENFKSVESYSRLLLTSEFYERFTDYEYILIYQLDAFVFSDQLEYFCSLNYDYIGAPWSTWHFYDSINIPGCYVGNGGFSLRKVESAIRILQHIDKVCEMAGEREKFYIAEDIFWSYCGTIPSLNFNIPNINIALRFSVESNQNHIFQQIHKRLPFGCHCWSRNMFNFWRPIIEKFGYTLPVSVDYLQHEEIRWNANKRNLVKRISRRYNNRQRINDILARLLSMEETYSIWGYGNDGKRCINLLRLANINISKIYDKNSTDLVNYHKKSIFVEYPNEETILKDKSKILIATLKYEKEIGKYLEQLNLSYGKDFYYYSDLENRFVKFYYNC